MFAAAMLMLASCANELVLEVSNATDVARSNETVELAWSDIKVCGLTPENVIVLDAEGAQVPSQVISCCGEPKALVFQVSLDAGFFTSYTVKAGEREAYPALVFGRQVPERYEDYAWESNKIAYRLYGPALETSPEKLVSPGIDIWVKSADKLVIDEWYARGNYHHNYGDGMDCYKVGRTLGGGACAPYVDGKLWNMTHNYAEYETLANGPVRTTVKLTYPAYDVNGQEVSMTKIISLDANQRFNKTVVSYAGEYDYIPTAAGFVRHNVKETVLGDNWVAFCEEVSDSKDPVRDGDIYTAVLMEGSAILADELGHSMAVAAAENGKSVTYYAGAGWSLGGIADMAQWTEEVMALKAAVESPLIVTIK